MTPIVYQYTSVKDHHTFPCAYRLQRTEYLHSVNGVDPEQIRFSVTGRIFS